MNAVIGRIIAAVVASLLGWVSVRFGIAFPENEVASATAEVTTIVVGFILLLYGVIHKSINRLWAPMDTAKPMEESTVPRIREKT